MELALLEIIAAIKAGGCSGCNAEGAPLDAAWLDKLVRRRNREMHDGTRHVAKKRLLPFYLQCKDHDRARWESWEVDAACEEQLVRLLKAKPRRTASGVATITVITKPQPCSSACVYCPNDVRMPKSYLFREPACQRAERNCFDPYLQVASRLRALVDMGHVTDKVELIVLGGTWSDYSLDYQVWFVSELFRALNDAGLPGVVDKAVAARETLYASCGISCDADVLQCQTEAVQQDVNAGKLTYNQAVRQLYGLDGAGSANRADGVSDADESDGASDVGGTNDAGDADGLDGACDVGGVNVAAVGAEETSDVDDVRGAGNASGVGSASAVGASNATAADGANGWRRVSRLQRATFAELEREHVRNESARHRVVGLVIETRPDLVTAESLTTMRRLGCTKVQIGIQSLDERILRANERRVSVERIAEAFSLLRLFGFKIHVHFMVNLLGATPEQDVADYRMLVEDARFLPDEVKLYPCCVVESARLGTHLATGAWQPYAEDALVDVLVHDVFATPAYTRISRMIRDISSCDIVAGNKKTNLRQLVEARVEERALQSGEAVREIRQREISTDAVTLDELSLEYVSYETSVSTERFLQWVTSQGRIAGFLRLSLYHEGLRDAAMIREVHVYGKVARLGAAGEGAQHLGLGRRLVEEACDQARAAGFDAVDVISSVGTRNYYRGLGFADVGLYQRRVLAYNTETC